MKYAVNQFEINNFLIKKYNKFTMCLNFQGLKMFPLDAFRYFRAAFIGRDFPEEGSQNTCDELKFHFLF